MLGLAPTVTCMTKSKRGKRNKKQNSNGWTPQVKVALVAALMPGVVAGINKGGDVAVAVVNAAVTLLGA